MKLHYVQYATESDDGEDRKERASWHTSGDAASKATTALKSNDSVDRKSIKRGSIDVPTKKEELVGFLTSLTSDTLHESINFLSGGK